MRLDDGVTEDLVDIIINTRDFCGNEKRAVFEHLTDLGVRQNLRQKYYQKACRDADELWDTYRDEAREFA